MQQIVLAKNYNYAILGQIYFLEVIMKKKLLALALALGIALGAGIQVAATSGQEAYVPSDCAVINPLTNMPSYPIIPRPYK